MKLESENLSEITKKYRELIVNEPQTLIDILKNKEITTDQKRSKAESFSKMIRSYIRLLTGDTRELLELVDKPPFRDGFGLLFQIDKIEGNWLTLKNGQGIYEGMALISEDSFDVCKIIEKKKVLEKIVIRIQTITDEFKISSNGKLIYPFTDIVYGFSVLKRVFDLADILIDQFDKNNCDKLFNSEVKQEISKALFQQENKLYDLLKKLNIDNNKLCLNKAHPEEIYCIANKAHSYKGTESEFQKLMQYVKENAPNISDKIALCYELDPNIKGVNIAKIIGTDPALIYRNKSYKPKSK